MLAPVETPINASGTCAYVSRASRPRDAAVASVIAIAGFELELDGGFRAGAALFSGKRESAQSPQNPDAG